jgi:hypothetical protein
MARHQFPTTPDTTLKVSCVDPDCTTASNERLAQGCSGIPTTTRAPYRVAVVLLGFLISAVGRPPPAQAHPTEGYPKMQSAVGEVSDVTQNLAGGKAAASTLFTVRDVQRVERRFFIPQTDARAFQLVLFAFLNHVTLDVTGWADKPSEPDVYVISSVGFLSLLKPPPPNINAPKPAPAQPSQR